MSVVGDFSIPTNAFALEEALSTVPEMTIKADRLASHSPKEVFPFLWGSGGNSSTSPVGKNAHDSSLQLQSDYSGTTL